MPQFDVVTKKNASLKDLLASIVPPSTGQKAPWSPSPLIPGAGTGTGRTPESRYRRHPETTAQCVSPTSRSRAHQTRHQLPRRPKAAVSHSPPPPCTTASQTRRCRRRMGRLGRAGKRHQGFAPERQGGSRGWGEGLTEPDAPLPDDGSRRNRGGWIPLL